jgi:cell division protein FtsB
MDPSPSADSGSVGGRPSEASRLSRFSRWLRPALVVGLLTFATAVVVGNVLPTRAELAATRRRLEATQADNERLKRRIAALTDEAKRLERDPWATERILRDELKMSADNEILIR